MFTYASGFGPSSGPGGTFSSLKEGGTILGIGKAPPFTRYPIDITRRTVNRTSIV